jgi:hypothetical protein
MDSKARGLRGRLRRFPLLLVGLLLATSGFILLAWMAWLVWYDVTVWGKDVASIIFDSRAGEVMSLGLGVRAFHYLVLGLAFCFIGPLTLIIHSANSLSMTMERLETSHTAPHTSVPTHLTANITVNVLNNGVFPVQFRVGDVKLNINDIDISSRRRQYAIFVENEYTIPRFGSCQFMVSGRLTGEEADALFRTKKWTILMVVTGEASCSLYTVPVSARPIFSDNFASRFY